MANLNMSLVSLLDRQKQTHIDYTIVLHNINETQSERKNDLHVDYFPSFDGNSVGTFFNLILKLATVANIT